MPLIFCSQWSSILSRISLDQERLCSGNLLNRLVQEISELISLFRMLGERPEFGFVEVQHALNLVLNLGFERFHMAATADGAVHTFELGIVRDLPAPEGIDLPPVRRAHAIGGSFSRGRRSPKDIFYASACLCVVSAILSYTTTTLFRRISGAIQRRRCEDVFSSPAF